MSTESENTSDNNLSVDSLAPCNNEHLASKDWVEGLFTTADKAIAVIRKHRKGHQVMIHCRAMLFIKDDQDKYFDTSESLPVSFDVACAWVKKVLREGLVKRGATLKVTVCSNCIFLG